jgi:hypothetical protein
MMQSDIYNLNNTITGCVFRLVDLYADKDALHQQLDANGIEYSYAGDVYTLTDNVSTLRNLVNITRVMFSGPEDVPYYELLHNVNELERDIQELRSELLECKVAYADCVIRHNKTLKLYGKWSKMGLN